MRDNQSRFCGIKIMSFQYPNDFPSDCETLNREHERIVELVNRFEILANTNANIRDLYILYNHISACLADHFLTEEDQMRAARYNYIDEHADEHRALFHRLTGTETLFEIAASGIECIVLDFFYTWFLEHVSTSDRKFGEFLLNNGSA
jgi:hemerythrin